MMNDKKYQYQNQGKNRICGYYIIINSKPTIMANIESVLSFMWQKKEIA